MKQLQLLLFVLFSTSIALAQVGATYKIKGKVKCDLIDLESINIENVESERTTVTDKMGYFFIEARVGETLVLSSIQLKKVYKIITDADLDNDILYVLMTSKTEELKEVVIEKSEIDAASLGIVSPNQKTYTAAERKVRTATTGLLDPLLNKLSGRTELLKKQVQIEKNEKFLLRLEYLFDENYYIDKLQIPEDYVKGFQYFAVENIDLQHALTDKNKTLAKFVLINLSKDYLKILEPKKE